MMTSKPKLMTKWWSGAQLHEFHRTRGSKVPDGAWLGALGPKIGAPEKLHHLYRDRCTKSRLHKSRRHKSLGKSFLVTNCCWAAVKLTHCSWLWSKGSLTKCLRWSQILGTFERAGNCFWTTTIYLRPDLNSESNDILSSSFLQRTKPRPQSCFGSQHLG